MTDIKQSITGGLQAAVTVFPLALTICACSPLGFGGCLVLCAIGCLLFPFCGLTPSYGGFALVFSCASLCGNTAAFIAMAVGGALLLLTHKVEKLQRLAFAPAVGVLTLALALYFTVMQTTLYFGIGATGNSVIQMIRSYVSLGFHGNWRGVLYGTITLVLMITYPRKFKKLCKIVPAPFWCIVFTTLLNLWLNPNPETTAIAEVGSISAAPVFLWQNASLTPMGALGGAVFGMALFLLLAYQINTAACGADAKTGLITGGASLLGGVCCGFPMAPTQKKTPTKQQTAVAALFSLALLSLAAAVCAPHLTRRVPIPTLAVILIVGGWQRVEWRSLKIAFTSGIKGILPFTLVLAAAILLNPAAGVLAAALCGILFGKGKPASSP